MAYEVPSTSLQHVFATAITSPIPFLFLLYLGCSGAAPELNPTVSTLLAVIL